MRVGSIVKFKNKPTVNTPGSRSNKANNSTGILVKHCGTSSLEGCRALDWVEVMWGNADVTKCFKRDLIEV